ncbi:MAG TPA: FAD:protein FMN transferase [Thermoguttaceae bacterium]|nr:FAD:protein FMN transferase [Thermoguttaceae bacterium]
MTRKSSRRNFLKGKSAADSMADALQKTLPHGGTPAPTGRPSDEAYFLRVSRRAMACEFEIRFSAGRYEHGTEAALKALDLVDALEEQLSVFREDSEISRINRTAAEEPVEVEPDLFELLRLAVRLHGETGGTFDLSAAPLWEVWGFARRAGAVPEEGVVAEALKLVGSDLVEFDRSNRTVRFLRPGVKLNLGGIGKGYALDRCAEVLLGEGIEHFLIHGGNSSVLAHGSPEPESDATPGGPLRGWEVGIRHPLRPDRRLAEIRLDGRALATSGSWAQSFVHRGRRYGHILDPRTGRPAEDVLSATAIAPTATLADALSTAFYVMGPQATSDFCRQRPEIAAVLVCPVRHSGGIEIKTAGLAEDDLFRVAPGIARAP